MKTITAMATKLQSTNNHYHIYIGYLYNSIDHIAGYHAIQMQITYSLAVIVDSNYRDFLIF